jgi:hypothetical protein
MTDKANSIRMDLIVSQNHLLGPGQVHFGPEKAASVAHVPSMICAMTLSRPFSLRATLIPRALQQNSAKDDAQ